MLPKESGIRLNVTDQSILELVIAREGILHLLTWHKEDLSKFTEKKDTALSGQELGKNSKEDNSDLKFKYL